MKPTILFFDSGIGGLSVYDEVYRLMPDCHFLYCLDNDAFPYSEKTEEIIIQRTLKICQQINQQYQLDLIVVACNTASTIVLPTLRQYFSCPIVGTVPAIKPAAEMSQTKQIGLLATKGTVKRQYVEELIDKYAKGCKVERKGSTALVEMAEQKLRGKNINLEQLATIVKDWQQLSKLDTVILGCTHFPFLKEELQKCLPQVNYFLDSGKAIAKRVKTLLDNIQKETQNNNMENKVFSTKILDNSIIPVMHRRNFNTMENIIIKS